MPAEEKNTSVPIVAYIQILLFQLHTRCMLMREASPPGGLAYSATVCRATVSCILYAWHVSTNEVFCVDHIVVGTVQLM